MKNDKDYYARLVVYDLPEMKRKNVSHIANWLRKLALEIEQAPKITPRVLSRGS